MDWRTTYPTVAAINEAGLETLDTWLTSLPRPCTDVERTVYRRIGHLHAKLLSERLAKEAPEVAKALDALLAKVASLGI